MKTSEAIDVLVNDMINTKSAPNYKGWIVADENSDNEYVVTVQLKDGEVPSEQLASVKESRDWWVKLYHQEKEISDERFEKWQVAKAEVVELIGCLSGLKTIVDNEVYNLDDEEAAMIGKVNDLLAKAEITELINSIKLVLEWGYDSSDAIEAIEEIITEQLEKHKGE